MNIYFLMPDFSMEEDDDRDLLNPPDHFVDDNFIAHVFVRGKILFE